MVERGSEVKVGAVVVIAILIAVFGVIWLSEARFKGQHYEVKALFNDTGGLREGDGVTVLGVRKGKVQSIRLVKDKIEITMLIERDIQLKKDARAFIVDMGMMGDKRMYLTPGSSPNPLPPGQPIEGTLSVGITETIARFGMVAVRAEEILVTLQEKVISEENVKSVRTSLDNLQVATADLRKLLEENQGDIRTSVKDFKVASTEMRKIAEGSQPRIETTLTRLESASSRLDSLMAKAQSDKGTMGKLLNDKTLYEDMKRTVADVDDLVKDVKANPKKYFSLTVFGK
jgi:phospholipid/cholesterol/gamma-HCH transport system substrate-binding protein